MRHAREEPFGATLGRCQVEARRFFAITHKQLAVGNDRVIPSLALNRLKLCQLGTPARTCFQKNNFTRLAEHQQQGYIRYQKCLPISVTALLSIAVRPFPRRYSRKYGRETRSSGRRGRRRR